MTITRHSFRLKRQTGFTIVELLIVIVVIAILAAIVIISYNGIQARARDAEKAVDITTVQKALELYYTENNHYLLISDITGADLDWLAANVSGLSPDKLKSPSDTSSLTDSFSNNPNTTDPAVYGYRSYTVDGTQCGGLHGIHNRALCVRYILAYSTEGNENVQIRSLSGW